jgi:DNA-binding IclR family transcriptional regulator
VANSDSGDSLVDRVVRVLSTFDRERWSQTPAQIARRADLPPSTAHRLVVTLAESGLLEKDDDGTYRVGLRLWELATRGSLALGLREASAPVMERVQSHLRQHTQLAVLEGDSTLFVERLSHPRAGSNIAQVAGRLPLHASSSGLVLLAFAPAAVVERVLARPLPALSPETITDVGVLRRKLSEVRRLGWAVAPGSVEPHSVGIAVPVHHGSRVIAALGVVLPRQHGDERGVAAFLARESATISSSLEQRGSHSTG